MKKTCDREGAEQNDVDVRFTMYKVQLLSLALCGRGECAADATASAPRLRRGL